VPDFVTDTHGLIWYLEHDPQLGKEADQAFLACDRGEAVIYIPTICLVEIIYVQEKGRVPATLRSHLDTALSNGDGGLAPVGLTVEVVDAMASIPRTDVPDMPDRIIAATALHLGLPLISKDHKIAASAVTTI
jgi:PIN domain nuclease of toxin-antitoxin system